MRERNLSKKIISKVTLNYIEKGKLCTEREKSDVNRLKFVDEKRRKNK